MVTLLLATTSAGKIRELRELLGDLARHTVTPAELGLALEVDETGATFHENAELKARAYHAASGLPALAEDAGLEVEALGGAPGVQSARWEGNDYEHKNRLLIERLAGVPPPGRMSRYVAHMVLLAANGRLLEARGAVEGRIAFSPRGSGGFGYDPVFYVPGLGRTMAELEPAQKGAISHRGQAARKLLPVLRASLTA